MERHWEKRAIHLAFPWPGKGIWSNTTWTHLARIPSPWRSRCFTCTGSSPVLRRNMYYVVPCLNLAAFCHPHWGPSRISPITSPIYPVHGHNHNWHPVHTRMDAPVHRRCSPLKGDMLRFWIASAAVMQLDENGMQINMKKMEFMECGPKMDGTITINCQELTKSI